MVCRGFPGKAAGWMQPVKEMRMKKTVRYARIEAVRYDIKAALVFDFRRK
jgi:hypothetical protein